MASTAKFCGGCGAPLPESVQFCGTCGTRVTDRKTSASILSPKQHKTKKSAFKRWLFIITITLGPFTGYILLTLFFTGETCHQL